MMTIPRHRGCTDLSGVLFAILMLAAGSVWAMPEDAQINSLLRDHVDAHRSSPGIVVGVFDRGQRRLFAHGDDGRGNPVHADSLFEIGSITKVFTALLLAERVVAGEVKLDTTLGELLGERAAELDAAVAAITVEAIASHGSGLPRLADHGAMFWRTVFRLGDPYRGSSVEELYLALANIDGPSLEGAGSFGYSNFGYAVLGNVLAVDSGQDYASLLRQRVLGDLDLHLELDDATRIRQVDGHRANGRPASAWTLDAYAPAGALQGSVNALLDFAEQQLRRPSAADELIREPLLPFSTQPARAMGMGWVLQGVGAETLYWHNGGTGGFRSFIGMLPERDVAVVVLSNSSREVDSMGMHLLGIADAPQAQSSGAIWIAGTILAMLLAPLNLLLALWRQRIRPLSGWQMLTAMTSALFVLTLFSKLGAWREIPYLLWWASTAVSLSAAVVLLSNSRQLVWRDGSRARRLAEQFYLLLLIALLVPVFGI